MYGMSITREDGSLWLSPDFTPQNLINIGNIPPSQGAYFQSSVPSYKSCFFFVKQDIVAHVRYSQIDVGGYHALRLDTFNTSPGNTRVYAFGDIVTPHSGYGIAMYNANGEMVYHGEMRPLEAYQVAVSDHFNINLGYPCAIMPVQTGVYSVRDPQLGVFRVYLSACGASGTSIYAEDMQVASTPGPVVKSYSTTALVINTSKYD